MAAVLRLWESAIEVLHGLPHSRLQGTSSGRRSQAGTSTGHVASVADALYRIQCAHEGRVLPEATWKKMIRDKVRLIMLLTSLVTEVNDPCSRASLLWSRADSAVLTRQIVTAARGARRHLVVACCSNRI